MDNKLDELKAKAQEMLDICNDDSKKQEAYEKVKGKLVGFLNDMKKLDGDDRKVLDGLADEVRNKIVSFMKVDLDSLEKDAKEKNRSLHG